MLRVWKKSLTRQKMLELQSLLAVSGMRRKKRINGAWQLRYCRVCGRKRSDCSSCDKSYPMLPYVMARPDRLSWFSLKIKQLKMRKRMQYARNKLANEIVPREKVYKKWRMCWRQMRCARLKYRWTKCMAEFRVFSTKEGYFLFQVC